MEITKTHIIIGIAVIVLLFIATRGSENFAMHKRTRMEPFAVHRRNANYYNPGFGQQLGALETWHQKGFVSQDCLALAKSTNWDGSSFGALVSCLQNDSDKVAINNMSV